jgi:hypothetical protein
MCAGVPIFHGVSEHCADGCGRFGMGLNSLVALAGVEECRQATDKPRLCCLQKPRVPSAIPSRCFTISVRIRFGLSLRDQELFSSIPCESSSSQNCEDAAQAYRVYRLTGKRAGEADADHEKPLHKPPAHSPLHDEIRTAPVVLQTATRKGMARSCHQIEPAPTKLQVRSFIFPAVARANTSSSMRQHVSVLTI